MGKWENNILGLIPETEWLNTEFNPVRQNDPIDGLLGDQKTDNLMASWQTIAAEYQIPVMAQFHGFDTEAKTTFRTPIDTHNIEKGLIKVKLNQSERLRALTRTGVREDALYDYVLGDGIRLADQVITRTKVAKNELLATGKVTIKENNLNLTVDYGVEPSQTSLEINFAANMDVPGQIQAIIDAALDKGVTLTGIVTSKTILAKMRNHASVQKVIGGNIAIGASVSKAALLSWLEDEFGITTVITNDQVSLRSHTTDTSRQIRSHSLHRLLPVDLVLVCGAIPRRQTLLCLICLQRQAMFLLMSIFLSGSRTILRFSGQRQAVCSCLFFSILQVCGLLLRLRTILLRVDEWKRY